MLNVYLYGPTQGSLAVALEMHQRTIDQNTFPDYRGVFDQDKRTLWKFGGKTANPVQSLGLKHWDTPHINVPEGGEALQRHLKGPPVEVHELEFEAFDLTKLE